MKLNEVLLAILITVLIILTIILLPVAVDWVQDETGTGWGDEPVNIVDEVRQNETIGWFNISVKNYLTEEYVIDIFIDTNYTRMNSTDNMVFTLIGNNIQVFATYRNMDFPQPKMLNITITNQTGYCKFELLEYSIYKSFILIGHRNE